MKCVDDFRLRLGQHELVPIVIGGMGVDISTAELALEAARLGGVGHISDAMVPTVADRRFKTHFVKEKLKQYKYNVANDDKSDVQFDLARLAEATQLHVGTYHGGEARQRADLRQLHGKTDDECAQGNVARADAFGARCRHRWHHAGRRAALGLICVDRGSPAFSRCQAGHHRFIAARPATLPEKELRAPSACRTTW